MSTIIFTALSSFEHHEWNGRNIWFRLDNRGQECDIIDHTIIHCFEISLMKIKLELKQIKTNLKICFKMISYNYQDLEILFIFQETFQANCSYLVLFT